MTESQQVVDCSRFTTEGNKVDNTCTPVSHQSL